MPLVLIHTGIVEYLWHILILYSIQFAYPTYSGSPFSDEIAIMIRHYVIHPYLKIRHYVIHPTIYYISNVTESWPGGHSRDNGVRGCAALKIPFSCLSCHSQDPQMRHKSIHQTLIWKKNVRFPLESTYFLGNIWQFSAPEAPAPIFDENPLTSFLFHGNLSAHKPPSLEIWVTHTFQKKVECPPVCHMSKNFNQTAGQVAHKSYLSCGVIGE